MIVTGTPVEYYEQYRLHVKREDLSCPPPGPPFSKARGVWAHIQKRPEGLIGALDTYHSQAGHATATACSLLGKECVTFYPEYKNEPGHRPPQDRAAALGATLVGLKAGRSCILYHQARREIESRGGYMMPNALKLEESIEETAREVSSTYLFDWVVIPASSATIAAGVVRGFLDRKDARAPRFVIHLGYSRSEEAVRTYLAQKARHVLPADTLVIDEGYAYKDKARSGETPPFPCSPYYDLKAFRWILKQQSRPEHVLLWNVG